MTPLLECVDLRVEIDRRPILDGVSLTIAAGTRVAIVGESGSGKSTLLRALVGLETPARGEIRHRGRPLTSHAAWSAARREIALCWQDASQAFDPRLTLGRSIAEARDLAGRPPLSATALARLCAEVELDLGLLDRGPLEVSGGQCQRAGLVRALGAEPRVLLADEPTSALDRPLAFRLLDGLKAALAPEAALILVTHDLSILPGLVEDLCVLDHGRIVERGSLGTIFEAPGDAVTRRLIGAVPRQPTPG